MARKLRLQFPGAIYHVINRGNYRAWVFKSPGAKQAFERCLFAACERCGWLLHAFVIMGNHYHLAVETLHGNLVAGMHWLQSAFAIRFNRYRPNGATFFRAATRRCWWRKAIPSRWSATTSISIRSGSLSDLCVSVPPS